jgi:hypothetical protein
MGRLLFTVYDNKTDFPVIVDGTAEEAAKAMGVKVGTFRAASCGARGRGNRWVVLKREIHGGVYGKKGISGKMSNERSLSAIREGDT